jgi:antitoxin (DNA-binding transcriptional repressor) of toxin-antitoxin stability system
VMNTNRAMGLIVTAHVVLLGIGMLVLARRLGLTTIGATSAGLIAMAVGSTLTKTIQFEQILVLAWVPLLLVTVHAVITSDRPWRAVAAMAATTGAILLAGHPQLVYEAAFLAGAAAIGFAIEGRRWRRFGHLAAGAALGALIALPQLVAVLFATADSAITGGRDLEALRSPALSLSRGYLARAVLGTVQDRDPAEFATGFESIVFLGVIVSLLVVVGTVTLIGSRASRPWAIALGAAALLALTWASGPQSVLFRVAFEIVPGFDLARASARWLVIVALVAALFAGAGIDALRSGAKRLHVAFAAAAAAVVAALLVLDVLHTADTRSAMIWAVTAVVALGLIAANALAPRAVRTAAVGVLAFAALELGLMSLHSIPQQQTSEVAFTTHRTATTDFLAAVDAGLTVALTDDGRPADYQVPGLRPNANVLHEIASIDGYDGGVQITQRWADALRRFQPDPPTELPLRNSLTLPIEPGPLARMGVRYILLDLARPPADFIPGWTGPVAGDDLFEVWENPDWVGDAVAWSSATVSDDPAELLRNDAASVAETALVTDPSDELDCADDCAPVGLAVRRPRPERIEVSSDLDRPTVVSVAQQALPGWTLTVDGADADVVEVDGIFLGAVVPAGEHELVFTYRSPWLTATIVVSLLAIAATISLGVADTVRSRRRAQVAGGGNR